MIANAKKINSLLNELSQLAWNAEQFFGSGFKPIDDIKEQLGHDRGLYEVIRDSIYLHLFLERYCEYMNNDLGKTGLDTAHHRYVTALSVCRRTFILLLRSDPSLSELYEVFVEAGKPYFKFSKTIGFLNHVEGKNRDSMLERVRMQIKEHPILTEANQSINNPGSPQKLLH